MNKLNRVTNVTEQNDLELNNFDMISMVSELVQLSGEVEKTIFDRGGVVDTCIAVLKMFTLVQILCALFSACRYRAKYIKYDYHDNYIIEVCNKLIVWLLRLNERSSDSYMGRDDFFYQ